MKEAKQLKPVQIHKGHIKAESTAKHYGFNHFGNLTVTRQDLIKAKNFKDSKKNSFNDKDSILSFDNLLEEKIALVRAYLEKQMNDMSQPPMVYFSGPLEGNPHSGGKDSSKKSTAHPKTFNLDILGNAKSIADAIVIETAYIILKEHLDDKDAELLIEINSIGDKDSFAKFNKEFAAFCKKRLSELPTEWRNAFKKDPLSIFKCTDEACSILLDEAPKPMSYLSESSRDHFREVLEYIESLNLPYTINHSLIGSKHYSSGTIFQIVKVTSETLKTGKKVEKREVLAIGERYNTVSKKAWGKKEIAAVGATMLVNEKALKNMKMPVKPAKEEAARFYFIQLGYDAKLKSLTIIEMLRIANIAVHQSLSRDKITSQLAAAEKMGVPYILILGQKEAIEGSVTIRHMHTRVQETVLVHELVEYLKKLK